MKIKDYIKSKQVKKKIIQFLIIYLCVFLIDVFSLKFITGNKVKMSNPLHWDDIIEQFPNSIFPTIIFTIIFMWILSKADKGK